MKRSRISSPPRTTIIITQLAISSVRSAPCRWRPEPRTRERRRSPRRGPCPSPRRGSCPAERRRWPWRCQGPSGKTALQKPTILKSQPQKVLPGEPHEADGDRLARVERVTHHFEVQENLKRGGDGGDPEKRQAPLHEQRGADQPLAAADGAAQGDDGRSQHGKEFLRVRSRKGCKNPPPQIWAQDLHRPFVSPCSSLPSSFLFLQKNG